MLCASQCNGGKSLHRRKRQSTNLAEIIDVQKHVCCDLRACCVDAKPLLFVFVCPEHNCTTMKHNTNQDARAPGIHIASTRADTTPSHQATQEFCGRWCAKLSTDYLGLLCRSRQKYLVAYQIKKPLFTGTRRYDALVLPDVLPFRSKSSDTQSPVHALEHVQRSNGKL